MEWEGGRTRDLKKVKISGNCWSRDGVGMERGGGVWLTRRWYENTKAFRLLLSAELMAFFPET